MAVEPIKIKGIRELQSALKQMDGEYQKQLRVLFNEVAETVAAGSRRRVPTRSGAAKKSVRVSSSQREARVSGGSKKVPYYGWLDFGGKVGRNKKVSRPFTTRGRYIYLTYDANKPGIQKALEDSLIELARNAGLEVE